MNGQIIESQYACILRDHPRDAQLAQGLKGTLQKQKNNAKDA